MEEDPSLERSYDNGYVYVQNVNPSPDCLVPIAEGEYLISLKLIHPQLHVGVNLRDYDAILPDILPFVLVLLVNDNYFELDRLVLSTLKHKYITRMELNDFHTG